MITAGECVVRKGNLQVRMGTQSLESWIGLTPEAGGRSSRPNHGLMTVVTEWRLSARDVIMLDAAGQANARLVTTHASAWFGRGTSSLARECDESAS